MSWPKPAITSEKSLKPPKLKRWFIVLLIVLAVSALLIFLFKPQQSTTDEIISYLAVLTAEVIIWALVFSWRMFSHGLEVDRFESWEKEKQLIDLRWNNWASRHLVILSSHLMLPEGKSAKSFLVQSSDMPVNARQAVPLEFIQDDQLGNRQQQAISEMLFSQFATLSALPETQRIKVEILTSNNIFNPIKEDFYAAWQQLNLPHVTDLSVRKTFDFSAIEQWIDNPDHEVKLLLILQLEDIYSNMAFMASEFVSSLLLVDEQLAKTLTLTPVAQLLRPMMTDEKTVSDDLQQMHEIQLEMREAHHLWLTGFDNKPESDVVGYLSELNLDLGQSKEKSGSHYIDLYQGLPGKLNGWLALSLAVSALKQTGEAQLAASHIDNQIAFNLIYPLEDKKQKDKA
ncbi:hypothetical protein EKN56_07310 [Limnobaculum zhutongyuii]|uniref:Uncharacterized protein n=1 Tax=Limnobaculum zhutongyuii TaxID=2498113 RepID=A0A411WJ61_9GAMM|nr:hypothetical protein [Limnobaculum zhutongyuii]QBH96224.1 hypothetical protein EKN56_07310 [Limnobaculum zhutongyuii]TQS86189.1 hypothetical protein ELQ32_20060 [Limnobaculum zhutongyuii]